MGYLMVSGFGAWLSSNCHLGKNGSESFLPCQDLLGMLMFHRTTSVRPSALRDL